MTQSLVESMKSEGALITNSLLHNSYLKEPSDDFESFLDDEVRHQLEAALDDYNRFSKLLSFHPSRIPFHVYISFYESLKEQLDQRLLETFLKRLTFHRQYSSCWKVISESYSTLTDLEVIIEVIVAEIQANNDKDYGLFDFILAAKIAASSYRMFNTNLEIIKHIDPERVPLIMEVIGNIFESSELLPPPSKEDHYFYQYAYCRQLLDNPNSKEKVILALKSLLDPNRFNRSFLELPGWLNVFKFHLDDSDVRSLCENACYYSTCKLNGSDIKLITQASSKNNLAKPYKFLEKYRKVIIGQLSYEKQLVTTIVKNALPSQGLSEQIRVLPKFYHVLDRDYKIGFLRDIARDFTLVHQIVAVVKQSRGPFSTDLVNTMVQTHISEGNNDHLIFFLNNIVSESSSYELVYQVLTAVKPPEVVGVNLLNFIQQLSMLPCLSGRARLEIIRAAVLKFKVEDSMFIQVLFENSITGAISTFSNGYSTTNVTFDMLYKQASKSQRRILHNNIRSLAQLLSLLSGNRLRVALEALKKAVFNVTDEKLYIFTKTVEDLTRFLMRKEEEPAESVEAILLSVCSDVNIAKANVYRYLVGRRPELSLILLQQNQETKSWLTSHVLTCICSAVLTTNKLTPKKRLSLFQLFRQRMKELGYKNNLRPKEVIELINLIFSIASNDPSLNLGIKELNSILDDLDKIPTRVMKSWRRKLPLLPSVRDNT